MNNGSQLSTIGCCIAVAFSCWLMDVGHPCDCHMILEVVGCRSLCFGICRVLLSTAVVGCRLSAIGYRAQVVDCRVSSPFVVFSCWLSSVDFWESVADCRCRCL
jgi:hypothetical protein